MPSIQDIRLLGLDCDGVLTDGTILLDDDGVESKRFHVHDGLAIKAWLASGRSLAVITARHSPSLERRMAELGVTILLQGVSDKRQVFLELLKGEELEPASSAFMGDDLGDLPVLSACGLPMAPANACPEVREAAAWVGERDGGAGAVREAIEMLMRTTGEWTRFAPGDPGASEAN